MKIVVIRAARDTPHPKYVIMLNANFAVGVIGELPPTLRRIAKFVRWLHRQFR